MSPVVEKYMAQSPTLHIGFYGPFTNLPFWGCAMYFDHKVVYYQDFIHSED